VGDRYGCVGRHRSHTCTNARTIRRAELSACALAGIADRLNRPTDRGGGCGLARTVNRENRERRVSGRCRYPRVAKIDKAVAGIMAAIEDGLYQPSMKARMAELSARSRHHRAACRGTADVPDVHPGIAEIYKRKVARLTETLADPETCLDASSDIRSLVGKIVLHPGEKRGGPCHPSRLVMGIRLVSDGPKPDTRRVITSVVSGSPG
jgi:hypothetical protein